MQNRLVTFVALLMCSMTCSLAWGQTPSAPSSGAQSAGQQQSMPGMDMSGMSGHDMSKMTDMPMGGEKDADTDASAQVMNSMEGHMDMGPHMKMTSLRQPKPGDAARAQQVAAEARKASERYSDYHAALADGFEIFHPEIRQKMYQVTNQGYARKAFFRFNPEHPTSLLYAKQGDDYKLIGVMYTAPKRLTKEQLDERIPLRVAQGHEHVNFCAPPADKGKEMLAAHPQFGLRGSIITQEACDAAGGTFHPVIFNWMVHVYPFEKDQANIWPVERQHSDAH
ncbi:MAG TPA: hypothetical protein VIX37_16015 [Candidatus Sulfotelmatobacter sp.]